MDAQLKQRVVGAAVLVALGVIFIPLMLDTGGNDGPAVDLGIEMDAPTDFNSRVVPIDDATMDRVEQAMDASPEDLTESPPEPDDTPIVPSVVAQTEPQEPAEDAELAEDTLPPVAAPTTPGPEPKPAPAAIPDPTRTGVTAWVVQLGSFTAQSNAQALVDRLKESGYTAFIEPLRDADTPTYRVRVGPELTRVTAERIRDELAKKAAIEGIVMRYP